jgi:tetratricopeptide (TPR) repeat protein
MISQKPRERIDKMKSNTLKIRAWLIALFISALMLNLGCASKEEKKAKHLERAKAYLAGERLEEAVIELKNVVQLDPNHDEAYVELGDAYLKLQKPKEAYQAFLRAVSTNPDNTEAQIKLGQIFFLAKQTDKAREKVEWVLSNDPENTDALNLLAGVQVQEEDPNAAIQTLKKILGIDENDFQSRLSLARLLLMKRDLDGAAKAYKKAIALEPASRVAYIELARVYSTNKEWEKAEQLLKELIQASEAPYQELFILAQYYETREAWDQAEKIYLQAVEDAPEEDVGPIMNLGGFYARQKSYEKALDTLQRAEEIKKDDLNILGFIAQLHFDFEKWDAAETVTDRILQKDPGQIMANVIKARLLYQKGDFDHSLERCDYVIQEDPRNVMAQLYKGLSLLGKRKVDDAKQALLKTLELNPAVLEARIRLAGIYLEQRDTKLAREQIDVILTSDPENLRGLMHQGVLKRLEQDIPGAEKAFQDVLAVEPNYAPAHFQLGLVYRAERKTDKALNALQKALDINPQYIEALTSIAGIHAEKGDFDIALELCRSQKTHVEDRPAILARIEYLEGQILMAKKDMMEAHKHFERAIELDSNLFAAYELLAKAYYSDNKIDDAIVQYEMILEKDPKSLGGYVALGALHDQKGEKTKAEQYYRQALDIKKDFGPAANNLAWNLVEQGGNIDEALAFAQIAKENMPENAAVMDTLGYIYYLKRSYLNAVAELSDSVKLAPNDPIINYHMGLAYHKANNVDMAKEYLEKALQLNQSFQSADEARKILKEIEPKK